MGKSHKTSGIAIIGRTAEDVTLLDGQTVKTRVLRDELRKAFPDRRVIVVDTYDYKHHAIKISWRLIYAFWNCKDIFVLLSRNGRTFLFPVIICLNKLFHRHLYHDVVGGALPDEAALRPALLRQLHLFNINWVELPKMKLKLEELGLRNVEVLPNFKKLNILDEKERKQKFLYKYEKISKLTDYLDSPILIYKEYSQIYNSYLKTFFQLLKKDKRLFLILNYHNNFLNLPLKCK